MASVMAALMLLVGTVVGQTGDCGDVGCSADCGGGLLSNMLEDDPDDTAERSRADAEGCGWDSDTG